MSPARPQRWQRAEYLATISSLRWTPTVGTPTVGVHRAARLRTADTAGWGARCLVQHGTATNTAMIAPVARHITVALIVAYSQSPTMST